MRLPALLASTALHAAVIGGVVLLGHRAWRAQVEVQWMPSLVSMPQQETPDPTADTSKAEHLLPPVQPEPATPLPPPETAMVDWCFAPLQKVRASAQPTPAPRAADPQPEWLALLNRPQPAATPPPAPAADFVEAVADDANNQPPTFPLESQRRGEHGVVTVRLWIDATGAVTDVRVVASSGHLRLDRAAVAALRTWRFHPARRDGAAVAASIDQDVEFRLHAAPPAD